jgi:hypothetical protein
MNQTNGSIVIALYRPHAGREEELRDILRNHVPTLQREGLATSREALILQGQDGTILEIFEWINEDASRLAHENEAVKPLWDRISELADLITLSDLAEANTRFPHFREVK